MENEYNYDEEREWVDMMYRIFGASPTNLNNIDDVVNGVFRTNNGLRIEIEYNIVGYGNSDKGIECDAFLNGKVDRYDVMDYIESVVNSSNGYFNLEMENYTENSNFVRFKLVPNI